MKKAIIFVLLFLLAAFSFAIDPLLELKNIQEKISFAYSLDDISLLDSCINEIQTLLLQNGQDFSVQSKGLLLLGDAYFFKGSFTIAIENYDKAISISGKDSEYYPYSIYSKAYSQYHAALGLSEPQKTSLLRTALTVLDELSQYSDYSQDSYLLKGMVLKELGDTLQAVANLEKVTSTDLLGFASYYKGLVLYDQKNYPSSILAFQKARESGQKKELIAASIYQAIQAMVKLQNYREALKYSEELVRDYSDTKYRNEIFTLHVEILYRSGEYSSAAKYVENVIANARTDKEKMDAYYAMGWIAYKSDKSAQAIESWTKAIDSGKAAYNEQAFSIAQTVIDVLREGGNQTALVAFLNKAKSLFPSKSNEMELETAKVYISIKNFNEAEVILNRIINSGRLYSESNYWMAQLSKEKGDFLKATEYVDRAIGSGNQKMIFTGLSFKGDLYFQQGKFDLAKQAYESALLNASESEKALTTLNLGIVALSAKDYSAAQSRFSSLKANFQNDLPSALDASFYLADSCLERGNYSEAVKEYDWIIKNDTTGKYYKSATLKKFEVELANTQDKNLLIAKIQSAIDSTTDFSMKKELTYMKGDAYLQNSDVYSAYETVKSLSEIDLSESSYSGVLYIKGRYFSSMGNESEMERYFNELVEKTPMSAKAPWAIQDLGLYYYNKGNYDKAKNLFFKLITAYPDFIKADAAYYYIGLCYEKSLDIDKARKIYQDLIEKFPDSTKIFDAKNKLEWLK